MTLLTRHAAVRRCRSAWAHRKALPRLSDSLGTLPCCVGPVQKLWQPLRIPPVTRSVLLHSRDNMMHMWYAPGVVLIDVDTLKTLPDRELASGISEIIKYGLIRDPALFAWLEANMERLLQRDPEARAALFACQIRA